jgi:hypothetical protein
MRNSVILPDSSNLIIMPKTAARIDPRMLTQFNADQKRQIIEGINSGIDISVYANPELDSRQMKVIRKALEGNIPIHPYVRKEFDAEHLNVIKKALEHGDDMSLYDNPEIDASVITSVYQMVRNGIHPGNIRPYITPEYNAEQMEQFRAILALGRDPGRMADPRLSPGQMRLIREAYGAGMGEREVGILVGQRQSGSLYDEKQMRVILNALLHLNTYGDVGRIDINRILNPDISGNDMETIHLSMLKNIDIDTQDFIENPHKYANTLKSSEYENLNPPEKVLFLIAYSLIGEYARFILDEDYTREQMKQIVSGIEHGVDAQSYADPRLTPSEMRRERENLIHQQETEG